MINLSFLTNEPKKTGINKRRINCSVKQLLKS